MQLLKRLTYDFTQQEWKKFKCSITKAGDAVGKQTYNLHGL